MSGMKNIGVSGIMRKIFCVGSAVLLSLVMSVGIFAQDKTDTTKKSAKKGAKTEAAAADVKPWEVMQPEHESLDYGMYQRIRVEALQHSHVMDYASGLMDGIGPRLTGSPNLKKANEWTRDQFTAMGCANAHLEDWGEFGMGWVQNNTWMRMSAPDTAVFITQAAPWSPATKGPVSGSAVWVDIKDEKDFEQYKGKLGGKIVFFGEMRDVPPVDKPLFTRYDDAKLKEIEDYPAKVTPPNNFIKTYMTRLALRQKIAKFFADEGAAAVITPSRDGKDGGGSGGTFFDDTGAGLGWAVYKKDHMMPVPVAAVAIENYGRVYRLLKAGVPVSIELNIDTKFLGETEHGFDTVAEIPGTDPNLKDQVVMVGGHLDSWASAQGATDNGAGTVIAMEVMRILNSLGVKPRRTIRVALWTGEEQGLMGSVGYVEQHLGTQTYANDPAMAAMPNFAKEIVGPPQLKPEQAKISGYFNVDNGSGKLRGIYLQGNGAVWSIFEQWMEPLRDLGFTAITMRNTGGTDHLSFDAVGVPGFQFIQDPLDYESRTHHSNMDTYERLQADDLAQAALVEAIFVYNTAMRDAMLPRKPIDAHEKKEWKSVMPGVEK
jgi:carboxypeptidase Q